MSLVAALLAGGLLGVRHAVETDHVAAVTALVDEGADRPGLVGASWGVGHSLPVAALGLVFLRFGVELPAVVLTAVEGVVGVLLVALGVRLLVSERTRLWHAHGADDTDHEHVGVGSFLVGLTHTHRGHVHEHSHGDGNGDETTTHTHAHTHHRGHAHPGRPERAVDRHTHDGATLDTGGFAVGAVHGLAGSGALVVALVATAPSLDSALAFLGGFSSLSIVTMAAVSTAWGRALDTRGRRLLRVGAGVAGVVVGLGLLATVAGVSLPVVP